MEAVRGRVRLAPIVGFGGAAGLALALGAAARILSGPAGLAILAAPLAVGCYLAGGFWTARRDGSPRDMAACGVLAALLSVAILAAVDLALTAGISIVSLPSAQRLADLSGDSIHLTLPLLLGRELGMLLRAAVLAAGAGILSGLIGGALARPATAQLNAAAEAELLASADDDPAARHNGHRH
jgi:hypothetical protein